jgi:hypothetical protein
MSVLARTLVVLAFLGACDVLSAGGCAETADEPASTGEAAKAIAPDPAAGERAGETPADAAAGLKAYVDPATGELLDRPPPGEPPAAPPEPPAAAPEIPVHVRPDGTVVADISDRFMNDLRVEIIDGKVVTCHRVAPAAGPTQREESRQTPPEDGDDR